MTIHETEFGHSLSFSNGAKGVFSKTDKLKAPSNLKLKSIKQVHSNKVFYADDIFSGAEGDGLVTDSRNWGLKILTADCIPLLASGKSLIGVCHAGWKGFASNIFQNFLKEFNSRGVVPADMEFAIGPSICADHFEVGEDVAKQIITPFYHNRKNDWVTPHKDPQKRYVNLRQVLADYLSQFAPASSIHQIGGCTFCNEGYSSYRRNKTVERNTSFIYFP